MSDDRESLGTARQNALLEAANGMRQAFNDSAMGDESDSIAVVMTAVSRLSAHPTVGVAGILMTVLEAATQVYVQRTTQSADNETAVLYALIVAEIWRLREAIEPHVKLDHTEGKAPWIVDVNMF
jgi:hypothetical protein